ncbi:hypothetical protein ACXU4B_02810 [Dyella soli]|uniref:Outer membrane protein beta-barrel domain-containing protein n=1 Tax=Dyella soli TaxID=522319 RepID=A0A4R0YQ14_9GAMM|nr:hypothetical protein [Dyella soli]TCI09985.1 hypothetical protein EZM97_13685 [Dyella soli]
MRSAASSRSARRQAALGVAIATLLAASAVQADTPADPWDGNWHGSITPYGWLPGVTGETRYQLPNSGGEVTTKSDNNVLSNLSGAFMIEGDLRKGQWGMYADIDWVKFSNEDAHFTNIGGDRIGGSAKLDTRWGLKGGMVNFAGLYTLVHGPQGYMDLLFGVRYLWLKGNLSWNFNATGNGGRVDISNSGHLDNQTHVTDAVIGIRGYWAPFKDSHFFFPYYADVGTGDSDNTYQFNVGVAYAFDWGDIALNYRDVEYHEGSNDKFLKKVQLSGPSIAVTWRF